MRHNAFIVLLLAFGHLTSAQSVAFEDGQYLSSLKDSKAGDSTFHFIQLVTSKQFDQAATLYPDIVSINVKQHMVKKGDSTYLNSLGRFVEPYLKSSDKLLMLSVFLREKYALKNSLFDQLLLASLREDNKNSVAMYFLAKLRYQGGFREDSKYLLGGMLEIDKKNKVIKQLYKGIEEKEAVYALSRDFLNKPPVYGDEDIIVQKK